MEIHPWHTHNQKVFPTSWRENDSSKVDILLLLFFSKPPQRSENTGIHQWQKQYEKLSWPADEKRTVTMLTLFVRLFVFSFYYEDLKWPCGKAPICLDSGRCRYWTLPITLQVWSSHQKQTQETESKPPVQSASAETQDPLISMQPTTGNASKLWGLASRNSNHHPRHPRPPSQGAPHRWRAEVTDPGSP